MARWTRCTFLAALFALTTIGCVLVLPPSVRQETVAIAPSPPWNSSHNASLEGPGVDATPAWLDQLPRQPPTRGWDRLRARLHLRATAASISNNPAGAAAAVTIGGGHSGAALQQYRIERVEDAKRRAVLPAALVVRHWRRTESLRRVLNESLDLSFVEEVVVWNNNPTVQLHPSTLFDAAQVTFHADEVPSVAPSLGVAVTGWLYPASETASPPASATAGAALRWRVVVVNSPENLVDEAHYLACAMAEAPVCFIQDDDWSARTYAEALYATFVRAPHLLHVATNFRTLYTNSLWVFRNAELRLHAGFAWLGCGSLVLRSAVARFVGLAQSIIPRDSDREFLHAYFSLWQNQYPVMLEAPLEQITAEHAFSSTSDFIERQDAATRMALRQLVAGLQAQNPWFPTEAAFPPVLQPKAVGRNGDAVLISNVDCVPGREAAFDPYNVRTFFARVPPHSVPQQLTQLWQAAHMDRMTTRGVFPSNAALEAHPYTHALDHDITTFWNSFCAVRSGEYYGVDLLVPQLVHEFYVVAFHQFQKLLQPWVSLDGITWHKMDVGMQREELVRTDTCASKFWRGRRLSVTIYSTLLVPPELQVFRYIKFQVPSGANTGSHTRFQVAEVGTDPQLRDLCITP